MPTAAPESNITVIDSEEGLLPLLDNIASLAIDPPSLYINLEGIALGRHGCISILTLYIAPTKETYLIDIHVLKEAAFSTTTASGTSLKTILESPTIPKVVFDIRNDSDALFNLFQVSVDGIKDIQVMGCVTRRGENRFNADIVECIEKESPVSFAKHPNSFEKKRTWRFAKEDGQRLFAPEKGGRFEIFNERPMKPELIQYCQLDVAMLPGLYGVYNAKLGHRYWQDCVVEETTRRVKLSQSAGYDAHSRSKIFGWDDGYKCKQIDSWTDGVIMETGTGGYIYSENDQKVIVPTLGEFRNNGFIDDKPGGVGGKSYNAYGDSGSDYTF
ncbi:hypothetical protein V495_06718 [Pseudogymnoascus sp. VKM F-4514 (FW-929)]|nr:hypothetical protein V495_06718 [Pseudogymnoascus sp. VKM F-4514 (FW-929)]KFY55157.1 hypothetical protein V497_07160 [Pseudogymnoascus sp. VKM F-4516 (FW-969)]